LLKVAAEAELAAEALGLAEHRDGVDAGDLHLEEALDRRLDERLRGILADPERHLVMLGPARRLLGDDRRKDHAVELVLPEGRLLGRAFSGFLLRVAHFRRASRCCTASLVRTRVSRRRMS